MNFERTIRKNGLTLLLTSLLLSFTVESSLAQRQFPLPALTYVDVHMRDAGFKLQDVIRELDSIGKESLITPKHAIEVAAKLKAIAEELGKAKNVVVQHEWEEDKSKRQIIIDELAKDHIIDTSKGFDLWYDISGFSVNKKKIELSSTLEKKYKALLESLYGKEVNEANYYWSYKYGPLNK